MSERAREWVAKSFSEEWRKPIPLAVLMAIADLADDTGVCQAGIPEIAKAGGVGTATVKRVLPGLIRGETISRKRDGVGANRQPDITVIAPFHTDHGRKPMRKLPFELQPKLNDSAQ